MAAPPEVERRCPSRRRRAGARRTSPSASAGSSALDGVSLTVGPGGGLRPDRPERGGEDDAVRRGLGGAPARARAAWCSTARDVSSLRPPAQRCAPGLRRTFQRVQTFGWLTVEDNVLAATEWRGGGGGFVADLVASPTRRRRERERRALVEATLGSLRADRGALRATPVRCRSASPGWSSSPGRRSSRRGCCCSTSRRRASTRTRPPGWASRSSRCATETGCAVLLVEHNAGFVMEHSDRVVVLDLGRVLAEGSPAEIQAEPRGASRLPGRGRSPTRTREAAHDEVPEPGRCRARSPARSTRSWRRVWS